MTFNIKQIMKRKLVIKLIPIVLLIYAQIPMYAQTPEVTVFIRESTGGCELVTDCDNGIICMDIVMVVDEDAELDSYNIWVRYNSDAISRKAFNSNNSEPIGDNSCVIDNGAQDTDLEDAMVPGFPEDYWRVAGVPGNGHMMTAGEESTIHTICFIIQNEELLYGQEVGAGGNVGPLETTVTFSNGYTDNTVPEGTMILDETFTSCSLLPVELLSFTAKAVGKEAHLNWITVSEFRNDHFEVERSNDGGRNFKTIGVVGGKGDSHVAVAYSFIDPTPGNGVNFYRLRQVDTDGRYGFSPIRAVRFDGISTGLEAKIWPNPAREEVHVSVLTSSGQETVVQVTDLTGAIHKVQVADDDHEVIKLDISSLAAGVYLINVRQSGREFAERIVIMP